MFGLTALTNFFKTAFEPVMLPPAGPSTDFPCSAHYRNVVNALKKLDPNTDDYADIRDIAINNFKGGGVPTASMAEAAIELAPLIYNELFKEEILAQGAVCVRDAAIEKRWAIGQEIARQIEEMSPFSDQAQLIAIARRDAETGQRPDVLGQLWMHPVVY